MPEYRESLEDRWIRMRAAELVWLWLAGQGVVEKPGSREIARRLEHLYATNEAVRMLVEYIGSPKAYGQTWMDNLPKRALQWFGASPWVRNRGRQRKRLPLKQRRRRRGGGPFIPTGY